MTTKWTAFTESAVQVMLFDLHFDIDMCLPTPMVGQNTKTQRLRSYLPRIAIVGQEAARETPEGLRLR